MNILLAIVSPARGFRPPRNRLILNYYPGLRDGARVAPGSTRSGTSAQFKWG
jgi:hypothetical protein